MKLRSILLLMSGIALMTSSAVAQNGAIDIFGDSNFLTCQANFSPGPPGTIFVAARLQGVTHPSAIFGGLTGAEFRIEGLPTAGLAAIVTPSAAANISLGDMFRPAPNNPLTDPPARIDIAFPNCQLGTPDALGDPMVLLYTVQLIVFMPIANDVLLQVRGPLPGTNPNFLTPIITICDAAFSAIAVDGGTFVMNPVTTSCTVSVEEKTWSEIKNLYN